MRISTKNSEIEIKELLEDLFVSLNSKDSNNIRVLFHPSAIFANIGNSNELFLRSLDEYLETTIEAIKKYNIEVKNELEEITHMNIIDGIVASVEFKYTMFMPESKGSHTGLIHLVNENNKWLFLNWTDRGLEIQDK
ncbi:MAG: nuclear transport factor 2 family protein [Candidatus Hodarchaeota archaeon]